jgi:hypothetical protein
MTAYLQDPNRLFDDVRSSGDSDFGQALSGKLTGLFKSSARIPLERVEERSGVLRWRFDQFGYPLTLCARMEELELERPGKPDAKEIVALASWVVAFDRALQDISVPRDKSGKVLGPDAPLGLAALLNSVVAPKANLSWESAVTAARAVQARQVPDRADVLLPEVWEAAQRHGKRMRAALLGALLATSRGGSFSDRLTDFVKANKLQPEMPDSHDDPAYGVLNNLVDQRAREDELLFTLYSQAVRQSPLRPGLWLQNVRDLAAYLRLGPSGVICGNRARHPRAEELTEPAPERGPTPACGG